MRLHGQDHSFASRTRGSIKVASIVLAILSVDLKPFDRGVRVFTYSPKSVMG